MNSQESFTNENINTNQQMPFEFDLNETADLPFSAGEFTGIEGTLGASGIESSQILSQPGVPSAQEYYKYAESLQAEMDDTLPTQEVSSVPPAPAMCGQSMVVMPHSTDGLLATIMVVGDSHLSAYNYGQHIAYSKETLYYEELLTQIAQEEKVNYYINAGDLVMKKDFTLEYRQRVDDILKKRRDMMRSRGGDMIYIRGNHDYSLHNITEYDYYAYRDIFKRAKDCPVIEFRNSQNISVLCLNLKDWQDTTPANVSGQHSILITHGLFTSSHVEGETMPNYGTAVDLTDKKDWAGIEYLLCGHIHTEHIQRLRIGGATELTVTHYLPCLSRPQYITKYEEGENKRTAGNIDIIKVYEDGTVNVEAYAIDFLDNKLCFNIDHIIEQQSKLEMTMGDQSRREALKNMAEELRQYETREVDPIEQVMALGNVDELYKNIVKDWFEEADALLKAQ